MAKDLNIRKDTIKLLEEITGKIFTNINRINILLGQSWATEVKTNKWDLNQTHELLHSKRNCKQKEKTTLEGEKTLANNAKDKRLTFKIYKQLIQLNKKKKPNQKIGQKT